MRGGVDGPTLTLISTVRSVRMGGDGSKYRPSFSGVRLGGDGSKYRPSFSSFLADMMSG